MHEAIDLLKPSRANFRSQARGCTLFFDIAKKDRFVSQQRIQRLATRCGTDTINHSSALAFQGLGDVPSHAFSIGHAENDEGLSAELEKIGHR